MLRTINKAKGFKMGFYEALLEPEVADAIDDSTDGAEWFDGIGSVLDRLRSGVPTAPVESDRVALRWPGAHLGNVTGHALPR